MEKEMRIDLRVSLKQKEYIQKRAMSKGLNVTEYILYCIMKDIDKEISKGGGRTTMEIIKDKEMGGTNIYLTEKETIDLVIALDKIKSDDPILNQLMSKLWNG